jgi:malonate transporter MadL subunit
MAIYGTALLSICLIVGLIVGKLIGLAIGIDANVGGVGIAMLLLILVSGRLQSTGLLPKPTASGVLFWSSIYIPIVVAMAASQNVRAALRGGTVAIVAGVVVVLVSFAMVALISRMGRSNDRLAESSSEGAET